MNLAQNKNTNVITEAYASMNEAMNTPQIRKTFATFINYADKMQKVFKPGSVTYKSIIAIDPGHKAELDAVVKFAGGIVENLEELDMAITIAAYPSFGV